jgi:hypothetical protein
VTARTTSPEQSDGIDLALLDPEGEECSFGGVNTVSEYQGKGDQPGRAPAAVRRGRHRREPAGQRPRPGRVTGGSTFAEAPSLRPGSWSDTLQSGEMLFYRVRADWGQAPRFALHMLPDTALDQNIDIPGTPEAVSPTHPTGLPSRWSVPRPGPAVATSAKLRS